MRPLLLALLLSGSALAQPVDTARGEPHTVEVSAGDALLIRVANHRYGPASSAVPVAIVQPDGAVLDEQEYEPGVSFYITTGTSRVVPDAQPGTWTTTFLGEDERVWASSPPRSHKVVRTWKAVKRRRKFAKASRGQVA